MNADVLWLHELRLTDLAQVGGKNSSLGEMIGQLAHLGVSVPGGFATTADAFRRFIAHNDLSQRIFDRLATLDVEDVDALVAAGGEIRGWVIDAPLQLWNHRRQLKMTRKQLMDEFKESEGSPELKARVRRVQQRPDDDISPRWQPVDVGGRRRFGGTKRGLVCGRAVEFCAADVRPKLNGSAWSRNAWRQRPRQPLTSPRRMPSPDGRPPQIPGARSSPAPSRRKDKRP